MSRSSRARASSQASSIPNYSRRRNRHADAAEGRRRGAQGAPAGATRLRNTSAAPLLSLSWILMTLKRGDQGIADAGVTAFAMELMPRITRAQSMDVLSSQANLAGYRAVIDAAEEYGRALPMMMTAAGTVPAAKVFIMGVGVAGLQAIATARRLGAMVTATDVRPPPRSRSKAWAPSFSRSRTRSSRMPRRRRLRQGNVEGVSGQAGRAGSPSTSRNRTSSSPRR